MPSCPINLVTALPAEAKPLACRFGLARVQPDMGFPLFRKGRVALVVTGPGKVNAAAGTAFLGALGDCRQKTIWVNVGVAGHRERPIGEALLASCVTDAGSDRVWYPHLLEMSPCPSDRLLTLDRPDLSYEQEGMVDMEASGFFPTACRYSRIDLVQVLKVISDNRRNTAHALDARQVRGLMAEAFGTLEALLKQLEARSTMGRETPKARPAG